MINLPRLGYILHEPRRLDDESQGVGLYPSTTVETIYGTLEATPLNLHTGLHSSQSGGSGGQCYQGDQETNG